MFLMSAICTCCVATMVTALHTFIKVFSFFEVNCVLVYQTHEEPPKTRVKKQNKQNSWMKDVSGNKSCLDANGGQTGAKSPENGALSVNLVKKKKSLNS